MDRYDINSTVSWGAILAGGFTAAAVTLIVVAFGIGVGLSVVSPWNGEGISATTASWSAGLFLVAVAMIASTFGGYITGRLRPGWDDVNVHERFFRDTAHGFVAWAFATVLTGPCLQAPVRTYSLRLRQARYQRPEPAQRRQPIAVATSMSTGCCGSGRRLTAGPPALRLTSGHPRGTSQDYWSSDAQRGRRVCRRPQLRCPLDCSPYRNFAIRGRAAGQSDDRASKGSGRQSPPCRREVLALDCRFAAGRSILGKSCRRRRGGKLRNTRWYEEGVATTTTKVRV